MNQNQIMKRYYKEFLISMAAYVITLIASTLAIKNIDFPMAVQVIISLTPVVPVIFVIVAILRALRGSDELHQLIQLNAVTFSAIATGLLTFSYGFLENIGFPKFPTLWIFPIMFFFWGGSLGYFWKKYQ